MADVPSSIFHALVFPFPFQGHINPLLRFSSHLVLHDCIVTFVTTESCHRRICSSSQNAESCSMHTDIHPKIRFVAIPDTDFDPTGSPVFEQMLPIIEGVKEQQVAIEEIINDSKATTSPISCIISDSFLPWTLDVAKKFGISRALFWTGNATTFFLNLLVATDIHKLEGPWQDTPGSPLHPGLSFVHKDVINSFCLNSDDLRLSILKKRYRDIQDNVCILINTFYELEGPVVAATPLNVPIRCVGPLLPPDEDKDLVTGSLYREEEECLGWLDKRATSSVLYISFGSMANLSSDQMMELVLGIEASEQPFLWVIRADTRDKDEVLLQEFKTRTEDRGMIISWAPQLQVLRHRAVGVFLTHCGWNSTVESIAMGVPMLCLPIFVEQPLNCTMIVKQWNVGLQLVKKDKVIVQREEVERMVKEVMVGEGGRIVRHCVGELRDAAAAAARRRALGGGWVGAGFMNDLRNHQVASCD